MCDSDVRVIEDKKSWDCCVCHPRVTRFVRDFWSVVPQRYFGIWHFHSPQRVDPENRFGRWKKNRHNKQRKVVSAERKENQRKKIHGIRHLLRVLPLFFESMHLGCHHRIAIVISCSLKYRYLGI